MRKNLIILHISQSNWWAIIGWVIRLGGLWVTKNKLNLTFSHSALGYWGHDGKLYVIEMKGVGARLKRFDNTYNPLLATTFNLKFKGRVKAHKTNIKVGSKKIQEILEDNLSKTFSVKLAIRSQFEKIKHILKEDQTFCSHLTIDNLEFLEGSDFIEGKNENYTPTEFYNYCQNTLKLESVNVECTNKNTAKSS